MLFVMKLENLLRIKTNNMDFKKVSKKEFISKYMSETKKSLEKAEIVAFVVEIFQTYIKIGEEMIGIERK
jgi:hypothetical protein